MLMLDQHGVNLLLWRKCDNMHMSHFSIYIYIVLRQTSTYATCSLDISFSTIFVNIATAFVSCRRAYSRRRLMMFSPPLNRIGSACIWIYLAMGRTRRQGKNHCARRLFFGELAYIDNRVEFGGGVWGWVRGCADFVYRNLWAQVYGPSLIQCVRSEASSVSDLNVRIMTKWRETTRERPNATFSARLI